jgi:hypothetical protein
MSCSRDIIIILSFFITYFGGNLFNSAVLCAERENAAISVKELLSHSEEKQRLIDVHKKILDEVVKRKAASKGLALGNKKVEIVDILDEPKKKVRLKYDIDWISLTSQVEMPRHFDTSDAQQMQELSHFIEENIDMRLIEKDIISREKAEELLNASCGMTMSINNHKSVPPYFSKKPGIKWDARSDFLAVRASAVVDQMKNMCMRGTINLRTGDVICQSIPCVVE